MGKLMKLSTEPFVYDWQSIADENQRVIAQSCVDSYAERVKELWKKAIKLQREDTHAKALCVYHLKTHLDHGLFIDVCQRALNINKDTAAALASVGKEIHDGRLQEDVLELVRRMEPRAANKLLKASPEVKHRHVATFQATGQVPSRRALQDSTASQFSQTDSESDNRPDSTSETDVVIRTYVSTNQDAPKVYLPTIYPTESKEDVGPRLQKQKIQGKHLIEWITDTLRGLDEVKYPEALAALADQIHRLVPSTLAPRVEDQEDNYIVSTIPSTNEPILAEADCMAKG